MEGGIHVPCIVRWPGVLPEGRTTDRVMLSMDLTVSIAHAVGIVPSRPWDGVDVLGNLAARKPKEDRDVFWRQRRGKLTWRAVRSGALKYVSQTEGDRFDEHLFDLKADISEKTDLKSSRPEDLKRLKGLMAKWEADVKPAR